MNIHILVSLSMDNKMTCLFFLPAESAATELNEEIHGAILNFYQSQDQSLQRYANMVRLVSISIDKTLSFYLLKSKLKQEIFGKDVSLMVFNEQ